MMVLFLVILYFFYDFAYLSCTKYFFTKSSLLIPGPATSGISNIFMVVWVILCSALEKLVVILCKVSHEYRYVSYRLAREKAHAKAVKRASTDLFHSIWILR